MTLSKDYILKIAPYVSDATFLSFGGYSFFEFEGWIKAPIGLTISIYIYMAAMSLNKKSDSDEKFRAAERETIEISNREAKARAKELELENEKKIREIQQMEAFTIDHLQEALENIKKMKENNG